MINRVFIVSRITHLYLSSSKREMILEKISIKIKYLEKLTYIRLNKYEKELLMNKQYNIMKLILTFIDKTNI